MLEHACPECIDGDSVRHCMHLQLIRYCATRRGDEVCSALFKVPLLSGGSLHASICCPARARMGLQQQDLPQQDTQSILQERMPSRAGYGGMHERQ